MSMDWDKLRIFHAVAEAGSFTHAGDVLNLSQSAVSRQISALEEALQVPLFHRHARGLILTEQGEAMNRTVREVFAKLAMTEALLTESKEKAAGRLKITTTTGFGGEWLTPRLPAFLKLHPDITITLILEDEDLDLGMREADVAIRMHPPRQPDLVQRHLADIHMPICAAPAYLEANGTPASIEEIDNHKLVLFGSYHPPAPDINWLATSGKPAGQKRPSAFEVNNFAAMANAIEAGLGIGSLPHYIVNDRPGLKKILTQVKVPVIEAYFVYPEELRTSKRVAVFRDFLLTEMPSRS
jgi:DNA-binding transcriptional LysR family regulator